MRRGIIGVLFLWSAMFLFPVAGKAGGVEQAGPPVKQETQMPQKGEAAKPENEPFVQKWGVEPLVVRLTASDHFLDFRFRVVDPGKATTVLSRKEKAFLIDQKTGKALQVSVTKIGALRGTSKQAKEGRSYVILFTNTDALVRKGDKVTVVVGDFRVENLIVE
jgi:hypothetical protein